MLATSGLSRIGDYVIWFSKNNEAKKYRQLFNQKAGAEDEGSAYKNIEINNGERRRLTSVELANAPSSLPLGRVFRISDLCGNSNSAITVFHNEFFAKSIDVML